MACSYEPRYFEDFEEGRGSQSVGRTVIEADFTMYSALLGNWTELYTNSEYAEGTQFGQRIAHGLMVSAQSIGFVYWSGIVERTAIAFLGMNYMDLPNPVFIGDTLSQMMVVSKRKNLGSRDDAGSVVLEIEITKQDGTVTLEGDVKFLTKTKSAAE